MINIMVMGAGSGPAVSIIKLLKAQQELPVRITATDMDPSAAGLHLADQYALTPAASEPTFVEFVIHLCEELEIKAIFCPLDVENLVLSRHKKTFDNSGIKLLCDEWEKLVLATDKALSICMCESFGIPIPHTYYSSLPPKGFKGEYILKPSVGCGATKNKTIRPDFSYSSIVDVIAEPFLCQEYIKGTEYSIDTLCDQNGEPIYVVPRERITVKAGQTVKGKTVNDNILCEYAKSVAKNFAIGGVGCLQCIRNDRGIFFIEYNPRYGTGVNLTGAAGINMPLLHLKMELGIPIRRDLQYRELTMSRYWREVFI